MNKKTHTQPTTGKTKKQIFLFVFLLSILLPFSSFAQCWNYNFGYATGETYTALSSPTELIAGSVDDEISSLTTIGFPFTYNGLDYPQFRVSSNGFVNLGGTFTSTGSSNALENDVVKVILAPLWDDLKTNSSGSVGYKLTGSSGSYILKIEFKSMDFQGNQGEDMNFQVWLYEADNKIEFRYGSLGTWTGQSASIGLNDETDNSFLSITPATTPTSSQYAANDDIANDNDIQSGLMYTFTKPTSWYWWRGGTSTAWATGSNWYNGSTAPTSSTTHYVTIQDGTYDPVITGTRSCFDITVCVDAILTVNTGANLTVGQDLSATGGEFELNAGTVTIARHLNSWADGTVDINGGTLNIGADWGYSHSDAYAEGTIQLSGGTINVADDCRFSSSDVTGTMDDAFTLTVGDIFKNTDDDWTVTNGTVKLTAKFDGLGEISSASDANDIEVFHLILDADDGANDSFQLFDGSYASGIIVNGNFTLTDGTVNTLDGDDSMDKLQIAGNFTMGSGATFKDATASGEITVAGTYSIDAASTYEYYGTTQGVLATTFGHLKISAAGTKSITGSTTVAGNLSVTAGVLSIPEDKDLTITGTTTNSVGTAGLVIKSGSDGSGSLKCSGTPQATVERFVAKGAWHLVAPMTHSSAADNFYIDANNDSWLTKHTESTNAWDYLDLGDALSRNKGYSYYIDANATVGSKTVEFTGTLIATNQTPTVTLTASPGDGWNLLGNPFPCALDFASGSWSTTNMEGTIWIYDGSNYKYSNGQGGNYSTGTAMDDGIIPVGQGFFVKAKNNNTTIIIPADARVHNTADFYKETEVYSGDLTHIYLGVNDNISSDGVYVSFADDATTAMDDGWDVSKLFGNEDSPQLYLLEEGREQSINHLPMLNEGETKTIPMNFIAGNNGGQTINASNYNFEDLTIVLEDLLTGASHDFKQNPVYTFSGSKEDSPQRFLLHFGWSPDGIGEDEAITSNVNIYSYGNEIYIRSSEEAINQKANVFVYDMLGREILSTQIHGNELEKIRVDADNAYVVVKVVKDGFVKTEKVFIK